MTTPEIRLMRAEDRRRARTRVNVGIFVVAGMLSLTFGSATPFILGGMFAAVRQLWVNEQ